MSTSFREIVDEAQMVVGEVAGAGVQTYGEDRMFKDAVRCFDLIFLKYAWDEYCGWSEHTLDGTLGIVDEDAFSHVRHFHDFLTVCRAGEISELPTLPRKFNPYTLTGTSVVAWGSLPVTDANFVTRRLQFWPKSAEGSVQVRTRVYPIALNSEWDWDDTIFLDKNMLVHGTAFFTLASDDLNPGAAETQKNLMDLRFNEIIKAFASIPSMVRGAGSVGQGDFTVNGL